jgi:hypothetical protein
MKQKSLRIYYKRQLSYEQEIDDFKLSASN